MQNLMNEFVEISIMFRSSGSNSGLKKTNSVSFFINGKSYTVDVDSEKIGPHDRLVDFIRDRAGLRGTKYMCREGGCGACVVSVRTINPSSGEEIIKSANSCLIPVFSCDGWDITTVEKLGNSKEGYHPIQQRLVNFGGTQCGYCSPGFVMNFYSLLESKKKMNVKEIERSFDGNICRCTGYRPILDAFKTLGTDCSEELKKQCVDIEDSCITCPLKKINEKDEFVDFGCCTSSNVNLNLQSGEKWVKSTSLGNAFESLETFQQSKIKTRIVAGNTGTGVYKDDAKNFQAFVDIMGIPELTSVTSTADDLILGGAVTLATAIQVFKKASKIQGFEYASGLSKHIRRVANVPVRNVGTLAGNLMLKHNHREFPSDLFAIFETVGVKLSIAESETGIYFHTLTEFFTLNMENRIIVSLHFKPYTKQHIFRSFKITRRYQNSHAYVNAGFLMKIDIGNNYRILEKPQIVFGGINNEFVHARDTQTYLNGKSLSDPRTLKGALEILNREVQPDVRLVDGTVEYRKLLPQSLLYKYVLGVIGTLAPEKYQIGGRTIQRNVTYGKQTYDTDEKTWPVNKPVLKLESIPQVSGEAQYINDINPQHGELFGAFVVSTVAKADIKEIDTSEAFKIPGVVRFIQARDIPGKNEYLVLIESEKPEEIFAKDKVEYAGQAIGLIVAESKNAAFEGAKKVKVEYGNVEKGILSIADAINKAKSNGTYEKLFTRTTESSAVSSEAPKKIIKGEFAIGRQYHFQMETQIAICVPKEDGMDVYSATQWIDLVQASVASALIIPNNEINIEVRRLGGAYGSKISRSCQIATACAVAAHVLNKPVRVALDLQTNMELVGKRPPYLMKYEIGVDDSGKILSLKGEVFCDTGISAKEEVADVGIAFLQSMYKAVGWKLSPSNILTNTAPNTWCRGPGSTPGIALVENIMEHIAFELNADPIAVRFANMATEGDMLMTRFGPEAPLVGENLIPRMIEEIKTSGELESRKIFIENFNKTNRWRKRGMAIVPMRYPLNYYGAIKYPTYVAIYKNDGTVVVSHAGIECGQGINTKVAQTVAFELDIPMEKIRVKPTNNLVSCNSDETGASITSEICCYAAQKACQELKARMASVKEKSKPKTWEDLVKLCNKQHISLSASYMPSPTDNLHNYNIYVVNLTEVEIDVLTGEYKIVRLDVIEDAGNSLNPAVDIGQVEGALVMGLGYWTTEKLIYDENNGQLLTNGTWLYKPPLPRDIPEDLRITLLKNAPNPIGILRSKATGEPPQDSAVAVLFAIKNAIFAARKDAGHNEWFQLDGPVTPEDVLLKCLTAPADFLI